MNLEQLLVETSLAGRICPQPKYWSHLWKMLPNRHQQDNGWTPPVPLILAAWWESTDDQKRERFHAHLRWAQEHTALDEIAAYINSLRPEDWHTEN